MSKIITFVIEQQHFMISENKVIPKFIFGSQRTHLHHIMILTLHLDRVVNPEQFIADYVRETPDPVSLKTDHVEEILETATVHAPGHGELYKLTQVDLKYMLIEELKKYRPSNRLKNTFAAVGGALGLVVTVLPYVDSVVPSFDMTYIVGNHTRVEHFDPMNPNLISLLIIGAAPLGAAFGWGAGAIADDCFCCLCKIPKSVNDDHVNRHADVIAAYLTLKERNSLWGWANRNERKEFWQDRIKKYAKVIANNYDDHRDDGAYGIANIILDDPRALIIK